MSPLRPPETHTNSGQWTGTQKLPPLLVAWHAGMHCPRGPPLWDLEPITAAETSLLSTGAY